MLSIGEYMEMSEVLKELKEGTKHRKDDKPEEYGTGKPRSYNRKQGSRRAKERAKERKKHDR